MKRILLLALSTSLLAGCGDGMKSVFSSATPTPVPTPRPKTTPPTPKAGEWLMKDYKNPLNQRPAK